jgi:uncharacterized protein (DUF885 family)
MGEPAALVTARAALDRFFHAFYRRHPVTATFTGVHDYDDRLPDWSPRGLCESAGEMTEIGDVLARAGRRPDAGVRAFPDAVDLALADACLKIEMAEIASGRYYQSNPALWTGEAIFSVISLVTRDFAPLDTRLDAAAARMAAMPAFLDAARDTIESAPDEWRARALRECEAAELLFGRSLPEWMGRAAPGQSQVSAACATARAAFDRFRRWASSELRTAPPDAYSSGEELLTLLVSRGHWCRAPLATLLSEARQDLDDAHGVLDARLREAGAASWAEAREALAGRHPCPDDYLASFERVWRRCREAVMAADLVTWPDNPIRYVPIPRHTREAAPLLYYLFYRSPAAFDRPGVHEYVVPTIDGLPADEADRRLRAWNDSAILLNHVLHHGGLGHHVQNGHASRSRSRIGQVAAIDGASRLAMFCGGSLAEGWACYAGDLAEEIGLLTPLERVAQQHTRVRLAARAVVDLALHGGAFSFDDAVQYYEGRGLVPAASARAEAVKTSMFPGTAVMYWLGTRGIRRLRSAVEGAHGSGFSRRRFHDELLSYGSIPVELIARLMAPVPSGCGPTSEPVK